MAHDLARLIAAASRTAEEAGNTDALVALNASLAQLQPSNISGQIETILNQLHPAQHTLGFIHLLHARIQTGNLGPTANAVAQILYMGSPEQIRLAPKLFCRVVHKFCREAPKNNMSPARLVFLLRRACLVLDGEDSRVITPVHAYFLEHCYASNHYRAANSVVGCPRFQVTSYETHGTKVEHVLRYLYAAGLLHCGMKRWREALSSFSQCLAVPNSGQVLSMFQVQAYKKYLLCSALAHGRFVPLPKAAQQHEKILRTHVSVYEQMVRVFETGHIPTIDTTLRIMAGLLSEDQNTGLANQAREAALRRGIVKLTETFVKLSLQQLAKQSGVESASKAEHLILEMVRNKEIVATIDHATGIVSFEGGEDSFDSVAATHDRHKLMHKASQLNHFVKVKSAQMRADPCFIEAVCPERSSSSSSSSSSRGGSGMIMGLSPEDQEQQDLQLALAASRQQ